MTRRQLRCCNRIERAAFFLTGILKNDAANAGGAIRRAPRADMLFDDGAVAVI
jgi:hypothetical protein